MIYSLRRDEEVSLLSIKCYNISSEDSDIEIVNGTFRFISDVNELKQSLYLELGTRLNSWYLEDLENPYGVKWLADDDSGIFQRKHKDVGFIESEITRVILKRSDVKKILSLKTSLKDRKISLEAELLTSYGEVNLSI